MKITLACIVGNEESVIERFVRSFAPAVDRFVFVRALGNQVGDETINIARATCEELGKTFYDSRYVNETECPHVDHFGNARQKAWSLAHDLNRGDEQYVMWADADDLLADGAAEAIRAAAESASHDVFILPYHVCGDKQIVMRERLVKASVGSKWKFAIHEQLDFPRDVSYRIVRDGVFIHSPLHTKTGGHDRNITILKNEVSNQWRNFFYLAQEYFQAGKTRQFIECANICLGMSATGDLERYEMLLNLAQTPGQDSRKLAAEAFAVMPDRREALALLTNYSLIDGDYEKALCLAKRMMETGKPSKSYWSQNNEWYGWKADELYRQCLRLSGDVDEAEMEFSLNQDERHPTFSIIHATLGRPAQALGIRELWLSRAKYPENVEYIFGMHEFDEPSVKLLRGFKHTITASRGAAVNYDTAAGASTGEIIIQGQDDCIPPQDWDVELAKIIGDTKSPAFVACGDGQRVDRISVNTIMTRPYMEVKASRELGENGFMHRGYTTVFPDTENSFRAITDGENGVCRYIDAPDFVIFHNHPEFNPGVPWDATYEWENLPENYKSGQETFLRRNPSFVNGVFDRKPIQVLEEVTA